MFARGLRQRDYVPAASQHGKARLRAVGTVLAAAIVASACGAAVATPSSTGGATYTPWPTNSAWPWPSPSLNVTPWPSLWDTSSPSSPSTGAPAEFEIAMGKAGPLAPAADFGVVAGTEINDFGFDLLRRLDSSGNLCASPTSIALALAMVRPGARGATATEMDKVLHSFGSTGQAREIVALLQALQSQTIYDGSDIYADDGEATTDPAAQEPVVELDVSNAVFSQKGMSLEQAYLDALSSGFGAGVGLVDYMNDPEAARLIINRWASDRTKGRIPEVLQPGDIDDLTRIALVNAIYLKAAWESPFDPEATKTLPFTRSDGSKVSVPTMAKDRLLSYSAGTGYRAVDLPYSGGSLSMMIVVPDDMNSFVKGLTSAKLATIDSRRKAYDVDLTLPRFSADTRFNLNDVLAAMGMPSAFDWTVADLTGISQDPIAQPLYIQKVIHQANIDVVEEGTTASAVTGALGGQGSCGECAPPPKVKFHVDKPFLYFIREHGTGAILFMGRIDDPSAKS